MYNKKQLLFTLLILLSIKNTKKMTNKELTKFIKKQKQTKFLSYLTNPKEKNILSLLKKDIKQILKKDSKSENITDAIYEIYKANKTKKKKFRYFFCKN